MKNPDARLLRRLQGGEAAAFAELLDAQGARVRALALRMGVSPSEADDVTQEIWLAVWKALPSFRGEADLATWVYRLAINICLKHRARLGKTSESDDELDDLVSQDQSALAPRVLERRELGEQVREALEGLSDAHRAVVVLHEMQGLTYAQCAHALQVPIGTVKSRLFHAFGRLRNSLGPYVLNEEPTPIAPPPVKTKTHQAQPCAGDLP